jgi:hypothetical protein
VPSRPSGIPTETNTCCRGYPALDGSNTVSTSDPIVPTVTLPVPVENDPIVSRFKYSSSDPVPCTAYTGLDVPAGKVTDA